MRSLSNPGTLCYLNVAVQGTWWALAQSGDLDSISAVHPFLHALNGPPTPFNILQLPSVEDILEGWSHLFQQHDVVEFVARVLSRIQPAPMSCHWEAHWQIDATLEVRDQGGSWKPLLLQHNTGACHSLQDLLDLWTWGDGYRRALVEMPNAFCVAIDRLMPGPADPRKSRTQLAI